MNGETLQCKVTITNPHGFHMRPATAFAQLANQFQSAVTVCRDDQRINGKSPLELMFLAAEQGTELTLEVSGPDARLALEALARVLAAPAPGERSDWPLPPKG
jgi:phosphocarrier protein HPr